MRKVAKTWLLRSAAVLVIAAVISGIVAGLFVTNRKSNDKANTAAIATNGIECAAIGKSIVDAGGNVADVAVATIICEGITCPQSSGLGGGFLLTIYIKENQTIETLNAREVAPKLATSTMFVDDPQGSERGGKAVAVPGEVKGLWELHQKYGKLPWVQLIEPNIKLARDGHIVSPYLYNIFANSEDDLLAEQTLRDVFIDPSTNKTYKLNEVIKRTKLAETLEVIAREGADSIYGGGSLAKGLIQEITDRGGIITEEDLLDYK